MPPFATPDVLVLAGGGVLGEAWMTGMLAGIEDATGSDLRRVEAFVGTSAGSIVAARLAGGRSLRRPDEPASEPPGPDGRGETSAVRGALRAAGATAWGATATLGAAALALWGVGGDRASRVGRARPWGAGRRPRARRGAGADADRRPPARPPPPARRALGHAIRQPAAPLRRRPGQRAARRLRRAGRAAGGCGRRRARVVRDPVGVRASRDRRAAV